MSGLQLSGALHAPDRVFEPEYRMTKLTFIEHNGTRHTVEATPGESVMRAALEHMIPGILADCGGCCSCATCHAYVDAGIFPDKGPIESDMLDCVLEPRETSRLTCQLVVTEEMGDIEIRLPASQI
jgi:2Fe-2S ferredoxin